LLFFFFFCCLEGVQFLNLEADMSGENDQTVSMNEIYESFRKELGHYPHTVQQLLSYSKQKNHPYKFVDYNKFWPSRPNPEIKPKPKPVNSNDYKRNSVDGSSKENGQASVKTTEKTESNNDNTDSNDNNKNEIQNEELENN